MKLERGREVVKSKSADTIEYHNKIKEYKNNESKYDRHNSTNSLDIKKDNIITSKPKIVTAVKDNHDDEWESF